MNPDFTSLESGSSTLLDSIILFLPVPLILLLGWIIASIASNLINRWLRNSGLDGISRDKKLSDFLSKPQGLKASGVISRFIYWIILLIFTLAAINYMGLSSVSILVADLILYLPQLMIAGLILLIGYYVALLVRGGLRSLLESIGMASGPYISTTAFYLLMVIIVLTALDQAGIDTRFLNTVVIIVLGGIFLAFAISFGIGSKDILSNILSSFYSGSNFRQGQEIEIDKVKGTIERIDATSCAIRTSEGLVIIPVKRLLTEQVTIKES